MYEFILTDSPIIKVTGQNACSSSLTVTLTCAVSGDLAMYGFLPWIQSYKGTLIRKINGSIKKYISVITIGRCNYQDTGNYTCIAWNLFKNKTFWANKTTILKVQGILSKFKSTANHSALSMKKCAKEEYIQTYTCVMSSFVHHDAIKKTYRSRYGLKN